MAFGGRRNSEAAQLAAERRQRENESPRLLAKVPNLDELKLEIEETREGNSVSHVRRIVVKTAPALFELTCVQKGCTGGGHDLTRELVASLQHQERRFTGTSTCGGQLGQVHCGSTLAYVGTATYRDAP